LIKAMRLSDSGDHCKKLSRALIGADPVSSSVSGVGDGGGGFTTARGFTGLVDGGAGAASFDTAAILRSLVEGAGAALRSGAGVVKKGERCTASFAATGKSPGSSLCTSGDDGGGVDPPGGRGSEKPEDPGGVACATRGSGEATSLGVVGVSCFTFSGKGAGE